MTPPNSAVPLPEERLQAALGRGGRLGTPPTELPLRVVVELLEGESLIVRVLSGRLKAGQVLAFSPTHKSGRLQRLEDAAGDVVEEVAAGAVARITLREKFAMEPGHIGAELVQAPIESNRFKAAIEWRGRAALALGEAVCLRLGRQEVRAELVAIERSVNAQGETVLSPTAVAGGSVAEVTWQSRGALVFDNDEVNPHLSRFTLATGEGEPSGCGLLHSGHYLDRARVKSENIFWSEGNITARDRAMRNGHKGAVVWLTGLSGSGKSTISRALERELFQRGLHVYVLDGDNVRHGLNSNLGFSPEDRVENIRRVAEVAKLLSGAGTIAVTAFISPYRDDRRRAREIALEAGGDFIEVFVDAPLAVCEQRDAKGLYKRARAGEIKEFTGISAPYEAPTDPEVSVRTDQLDRDACVARIIAFLLPRLTVETE